MATVAAGTALVLAAPVGPAEAPPAAAPDSNEPTAPASASLAAAGTPNPPERPATPRRLRSEASAAPHHETAAQPGAGREHEPPGQSHPGSKHDPSAQSDGGSKHDPPGQSDGGSKHDPPGQSDGGSKHDPSAQSDGGSKHGPPAHSGADPTHEHPAQSGGDPKQESATQPGGDPKDEPPGQPGIGPKPEPPPEAPAAPRQPPAGPTPQPGNGQAPCFLSSAGLICPGDTDCVITTTGVTCASKCVLTSAGLACKRGEVLPNPARGEVLPNPPVSGGPKHRPTPRARVKSERETSVSPRNVDVQDTEAGEQRSTDAQELPFSGLPLLLSLGLGCTLLAGGMLLRRKRSTVVPAPELAGKEATRGALASVSPRTPNVPSRSAMALQSLLLVACAMLLHRRRSR
jgi:hypothetical protein